MTGLSEKGRLIIKPFLVIAISFIVVYTFLHWLLFIKAGLSLKDEVVRFWLPLGLPLVPVMIWLRPRIKLLKFKNENGSFLYQLLAAIAIGIPAIIAQEYVVTATGKLTALENISQFDKSAHTKYYTLAHYYIDKQRVVVRNTASITGKHNDNYNMLIYIALPVCTSIEDTAQSSCNYWLGKKYKKTISNNLSDQQKDQQYSNFAEEKQKEFDETSFDGFTYLEVMGNNDDHDELKIGITGSELGQSGHPIIFEANTTPFKERNGNKLAWIFASFGIGLLVFFMLLLLPPFDKSKLQQFKTGRIKNDNDLKEMLGILVPKEGFYITPILIDLNLLVFIAFVVAGSGFVSFRTADLLDWGANYRPFTTNGQWWRLLTSIFLHGGLMHLVANIVGLLFVGIFLEPLLGKKRYLFIYLATGILGSLASIWWFDATVSVGASGAIFGLYGFFIAALLLKVFPPDFGKAFFPATLVFVGFNLVMGLRGGIDNAAHIGGLLSGFVIGLIMSPLLKRENADPEKMKN